MQFDIHKALMRYKLNSISSSIKGNWLDIGAGDQPYKKYFSGTESYSTTNTRRHYNSRDLERLENLTTYWIEDGKSLPIPDNSLDGVACFQVLSVIDNPVAFFAEINRVLKPGGEFLLTTDFLYPVWSNEDRFRHTAYSIRSLSENNRFTVETIDSFGGFASTVYTLFMRYMRSFPEIWKKKTILSKFISGTLYLFLLVLLPLASLKGLIIFEIEKRKTLATDFTFNILLRAKKN